MQILYELIISPVKTFSCSAKKIMLQLMRGSNHKGVIVLASYIQFLNVGLGIINNTKEVESWNIKEMTEEALLMDNPDLDVRIIGFRFYDLDPGTNHILKQSGIYYLDGEIVHHPTNDPSVTAFLSSSNKEFPRSQRLIKIQKPYTLVYPLENEDTIIDVKPFLAKIKEKKTKEHLERMKKDFEEYKTNLVEVLRKIEDAIACNAFNAIPLIDSPSSETSKTLNIMNDNGNFNKHIDYLRNKRIEILNLENKGKETQ